MSARAQLTITFTALFGAIVIALAVSCYVLYENDAYQRLDAALQVATGATSMSGEHELDEHSTKLAGERDLQSVLNENANSALSDTQILVCDGNRYADYKPGVHSDFDLRSISMNASNGKNVDGYRIAIRTFSVPKFNSVYKVYAAKPVGPVLAQLQRLRLALFVLVPLCLGIAGLSGYWLAKRSLFPLQEFARTLDAVTSSDLSTRVKLRHEGDEIGTLGLRFNSLLDRLEQAFGVQRRFMADASHQIRTPVTVALAAAQVISRDSNSDVQECKESLQIIEHQLLQLRRTVENMFFLSQADTASLQIERREMYLDDAVSEAVRAAKALAKAKQQTVRVGSLPEAKCLGDEDLLKQAILILLDNAVKFAPYGGNIEVSLAERGEQCVCSVTDNGPGISQPAQPRIFERFFQENHPGIEVSGGAGLGLAIAKSIVENHRGTIALVESHAGRTIFEIAIPIVRIDSSQDHDHANSSAVRM